MAALDLLGRRWVLRIVWELRSEPLTFRGLRSAMDDVSPSVLNQRLAELRDVAIVEASDAGYQLAPLGHELLAALDPLWSWSQRWSKSVGGG